MKKLIYILMFVFTIVTTNKTFAQEDPEQNLKDRVIEVISPEQLNESAKILNSYGLPYGKFFGKNVYAAIRKSKIMFGSDLEGRISVHSIQDDGTVNVTEKSPPDKMGRYVCLDGFPFIQIETRKKIEVVKFDKDEMPKKEEVAEIVPTKEREQPQKSTADNDDQYAYADQNNGDITVLEIHCDHKDRKEKVEEYRDRDEKTYPYQGRNYVYRDNGWVEFGTGVLVGGAMNVLLSNIFFRTNQNTYQQYQQYQQPSYYNTGYYNMGYIQQPRTYGSNIPGWH